MCIWYETDVRGVLPSVQAPALLLARYRYPRKIEVAEYVASIMPDATVAPVPSDLGSDELELVLDVVHPFLGLEPREPELDTILTTVLYDIVGSTQRQGPSATTGGRSSSSATTRSCATRSDTGVVSRTTRPGTASTRPSMDRRARSAARSRSRSACENWGSRFEPVYIPESAN